MDAMYMHMYTYIRIHVHIHIALEGVVDGGGPWQDGGAGTVSGTT